VLEREVRAELVEEGVGREVEVELFEAAPGGEREGEGSSEREGVGR